MCCIKSYSSVAKIKIPTPVHFSTYCCLHLSRCIRYNNFCHKVHANFAWRIELRHVAVYRAAHSITSQKKVISISVLSKLLIIGKPKLSVTFPTQCIWQCSVLWWLSCNSFAQFPNTVSKMGFYIWNKYLKKIVFIVKAFFTATFTRNVASGILSQKGSW